MSAAVLERELAKVSDGVDAQAVLRFVSREAGEVHGVERANGGLIHHVFRLMTPVGELYLKLRASHMAGVPNIECDPNEIRYERQALVRLEALAEDVVPSVVAFDNNAHAMLLSSVMRPGDSMKRKLDGEGVSAASLTLVGETVARIHNEAAKWGALRIEDKDGAARARWLNNLMQCSASNECSVVCNSCTTNVTRTLANDRRRSIPEKHRSAG